MATVNQKLLDRAIRHALYFQRFKTGEVNNILAFLDRKVFPDITKTLAHRIEAAAIAGVDRGPWTTAWVADVRESVGAMVATGYKVAGADFAGTMQSFAKSEASFQASLLKESVPFDVSFRSPSPEILRSIVSQKPIEGITFGNWWKTLGAHTQSDIMGAVSTGLAQGEKPEKIIRRLTGTAKNGFQDGVYQTARHRAEALVRTISSKIQNEATYASFLANADTIKGYQFVATLDTRTTTICMGHDGKVYDLKDRRGVPPLHWQCRSTIVAVVKSFEEIGLDDLGLTEPPSAASRASMNGEVPQKLTYPEWLSNQSEAIKIDALGVGKAGVFDRGVVPLDRFYTPDNRPLTLEQLWSLEERMQAAAVAKAARAAKAAERAAQAEAKAAAVAAKKREEALAFQYEQEKAAALRSLQEKADAAAAVAEQKAYAEAQALAEADAVAKAQADAAALKAAEEAAKAAEEIKAAEVAAQQAQAAAEAAALEASAAAQEAALAQAAASEAQSAAAAIADAQKAAQGVGGAASDAVVPPASTASPIEFGKAAKDAVAGVLADLQKQLKEAAVEVPGFADLQKKALKQAYDSAWKKAKDLAAKGKLADLLEITKAAAEKATAEIRAAAAAALADSVAAAEAAVKGAVAKAVELAGGVKDAKAAGQTAKAFVEQAYAKLAAKKVGKLTADEAAKLSAELKTSAKEAYDKAWQKAKAAEKKAAKAAAKAGTKAPTPVPSQAEQVAQATKIAEKAAAKAEAPAASTAWAKQVDEIEDATGWTNYAPQKGSNPGGFFRDANGVEWYVKTPATEDHAYNEVLAGRLYSLTGVKSAQTKLVRINGKLSVASKIEKLDAIANKKGVVAFANEWKAAGAASQAADGFAADAWLANWDAVGMTGDNLLFDADGNLVRIDAGGALRYRAKGGAKGSAFGTKVNEIDTLRGTGQGAGTKAAEVYKHLTDAEIVASIDRVLAISEKDLAEVVELWGPRNSGDRKDLLRMLIYRRADLRDRREYFYRLSKGIKNPPISRVLGEKWGLRVELEREAISTIPIEQIPREGPSLLGFNGVGDTRNDPVFVQKWKEWRAKITPEQAYAIGDWSGNGYKVMRSAQVGAEKNYGAKLAAKNEVNKQVLRVESALHNAPRYKGNIHRGIRWDLEKHAYPNFDEGDVFELEAISSFSTSPQTADSFAGIASVRSASHHVPVILHVDDSYSGIDIKNLSHAGGENEILALRRAKFRVKRIIRTPDVLYGDGRLKANGAIDIYLEEITA